MKSCNLYLQDFQGAKTPGSMSFDKLLARKGCPPGTWYSGLMADTCGHSKNMLQKCLRNTEGSLDCLPRKAGSFHEGLWFSSAGGTRRVPANVLLSHHRASMLDRYLQNILWGPHSAIPVHLGQVWSEVKSTLPLASCVTLGKSLNLSEL